MDTDKDLTSWYLNVPSIACYALALSLAITIALPESFLNRLRRRLLMAVVAFFYLEGQPQALSRHWARVPSLLRYSPPFLSPSVV